ncbi:MAG TPA: hypothetical protein DCE71_07640, partial [Parachlamydiales bacterium]|nr:hypothetical protein [Parachlamydiales bacterium]
LLCILVKKVEAAAVPYLMQEEDPPVGMQAMDETEAAEIEQDLYSHEKEVDVCTYLCSFF